jgi:hypothetical protein
MVQITTDQEKNTYFTGLTGFEDDLLRQCVGDADGDPSNNVDIINWDHGDEYHPHLIKLVPSIADNFYNNGFYAVVWYDTNFHPFTGGLTTDGTFRLVNPVRALSYLKRALFDVYVSDGVLSLTSTKAEVVFDFASNILYTLNINYDKDGNGDLFNGDISCEAYENRVVQGINDDVLTCLEKDDMFMVMDFQNTKNNPKFMNLYTVRNIYSLPEQQYLGDSYTPSISDGLRSPDAAPSRTHRIVTDIATNWAHDLDETSQFRIYKFTPATSTVFQYVAPCSNRGICDYEDGICDCLNGYGGPACSIQTGIHT